MDAQSWVFVAQVVVALVLACVLARMLHELKRRDRAMRRLMTMTVEEGNGRDRLWYQQPRWQETKKVEQAK